MSDMEKITCINCAKVINARSSDYTTKEVKDKVEIVFGHVASSNWTETNSLCCNCLSTFNTLFNTRATFNSRSHPDSKINNITNGKQSQNCKTSSNGTGNCIEIINLEDETEENDCLFIDETGNDEQMSDEVICLSDDLSNESHVSAPAQIEFREKFLQLKIQKLPTTLTSWNVCSLNDLKHCCPECGRFFYSAKLLENHQNVVHSEKLEQRFKCNFCDRKFIHKWFYKNHLDTCHNGIEILFSCVICEKQFKTQNELDVHKTTHRRPFTCKYCPQTYEHLYEVKLLRKHMMEVHENSVEAKAAAYNEKYMKERAEARRLNKGSHLPCFECDRNFENKFTCFVHVIYDHYNQTKCPVCKQEFMCSSDLNKHVEVTGHELDFCTFCEQKFANILHLLQHMYTMHAKNIKFPFICESCGKGFRFYDNLRVHYRRHVKNAGPPSYICTEEGCGKKFKTAQGFKRHMAVHKSSSENSKKSEKVQCNICSKRFDSQSALDFHRSKNHDVVTIDVSVLHRCPDCEFTSKTNAGITGHRRRHCGANEKKKVVKSNKVQDSEYIEVLQSQTNGEDKMANRNSSKYKCTKCGKVMPTLNCILLHLYLEHSVILPGFNKDKCEKCKTCSKIFSNKSLLRKHVAEKHGNKVKQIQFTCLLCLNQATLDGVKEMRNHFKTEHPDSEEADHAAKNEARTQVDAATNEKQRTSSHTDIYCLYCKKIFTSIFETDEHNKTVHKAQPVCKLCQHVSEDETSHQKHIAQHKEFPCVPCNAVFSSMQDFCNHLQYSHKRVPYVCEICGIYISTLEILMKHYKLKHGNGK